MNGSASLRAVGYVRVSTEEQIEGHSLDAQRREIERFCERNGYRLERIFADEGVSAHTDRIEKRQQLCALLHDAEQGRFDMAIVHTLDRWARNIRVQSEALQRLGNAGVGFISISENFDFSTPAGRMMLTMMGSVSEFFSDQLGVHVSKVQRERAASGLPVGPVPFGYIPDEHGGAPRMEPREADAVSHAFAARAAGQSNGSIADRLNREGLRTRTGRLFTAHAVKDMLNCRFYMGVVTYRSQEVPGRHRAIVTPEVFERVQMRRTRRGPSRQSAGKPRGILSGIIRCVRCGSSLHADRNRLGRPMYRERHGRNCETNRRAFVASPVDEQMSDIFNSLELRPDWQQAIAQLAVEEEGPSLHDLHDRRQRLIRAYADGGFSLAEYEVRLTAVDAEIRLTQQATPVEFEEVAALLNDLPAMWAEAAPDERRRLLAPLIGRVYVDVRSKHIAGIEPVPAFRTLIETGVQRTADCSAVLLAPAESPARGGVDLVETGEN